MNELQRDTVPPLILLLFVVLLLALCWVIIKCGDAPSDGEIVSTAAPTKRVREQMGWRTRMLSEQSGRR